MTITKIPYKETGYFSSFICNYLDEKEDLKPFYNRFPSLDNFEEQIKDKRLSFSSESRNLITQVLQSQYKNISASEATLKNIQLLQKENTFTITTGHQLNLFTGPLYFFYKIISTINLCEELSRTYPKQNFIPVYWMATEDHDFEEINFFNFKKSKIQWNRDFGGAVGELSTEGLEKVFEELSKKLGPGKNASYLKSLFQKAYLEHTDLAKATLFLVNELFSKFGLVILDGNNRRLKQKFIPYVKQELLEQTSFSEVSKANKDLNKIQVNPREINLFYLQESSRERIVKEGDLYKINNTSLVFTREEILEHLYEVPERFSPNVLLRPLYQEVILPNLCYIGGGGELAYWLQLKSMFKAFKVTFPMLLLRNSVLVVNEFGKKKIEKLNLSIEELFYKQEELINIKAKENSNLEINFSEQREHLKKQFEELFKIAEKTDQSFVGAVAAQEKKQLKGLDNLEKRLLKAEKRRFSEKLNRIKDVQDLVFPNQSLQERQNNFSEFYLEYGQEFIETLKEFLNPLSPNFIILEKI